jgi:hypothetical protein
LDTVYNFCINYSIPQKNCQGLLYTKKDRAATPLSSIPGRHRLPRMMFLLLAKKGTPSSSMTHNYDTLLLTRCSYCFKNLIYVKNKAFMDHARNPKKYLLLFLLYFLLTTSMPVFHSHAQGGPIVRDHHHMGHDTLSLGGTPKGSCCELHEADSDSNHTQHGHFLLDSHSVIVNTYKGDESGASMLKCGLPPVQAPLSALRTSNIPVVQVFPENPLKGSLSIFSGLSPPRI